jgi:RNA polymerase sigma factor FliA
MTPEIVALVGELIPRAEAIARRYRQKAPHALALDDLESIAYEGLMQAADQWPGYCARNGYQPDGEGLKFFQAYASRRMTGAILDHMRSLDWVPRSQRQAYKRMQEAGDGLGVSEASLTAKTSLSADQIRAARAAVARRPVSLDDGDRDVPERRDVNSQMQVAQILQAVASAGDKLTRPERVVLALRYYEGMSVAEIALALGCSRADVTAAHNSAVVAVRDAMLSAAV